MAINYTDNQNNWNRVFAIKFHNHVIDNPSKYVWYDGQHHTLTDMCVKFETAIYSGDNVYIIGDVIKSVCKELDIKANYKSINAYIK